MNMIVAPRRFAVAGGGGGGGAAYATAESLASQEVTTSFADLLTLSILAGSLTNGATYAIFWSIDGASTAANALSAELTIAGVAVSAQLQNPSETAPPAAAIIFGGMVLYTAGSGAEDFKIRAKKNTVTGVATFTNARISYLKLGAADQTQQSLALQSTTLTSLQTAATLTFTPATTGNYVVLASFQMKGATGISTPMWKVGDGITVVGEHLCSNLDGSAPSAPVFVAIPLASVSGSKTVTVQYRSFFGVTAEIYDIRMIAIREDRFANVYKAVLGATSGGTETSYQTAVTQTFTPAAADHLTIGSMMLGNSSSADNSHARFVDGGTVVGEAIWEHVNAQPDRPASYMAHRIAPFAAASRTQTIERKSEGTNTSQIIAKSAIVTFDLAGLT